MDRQDELATVLARLETGEFGNKLDVLIDCALFKPNDYHTAIRPNAAGTKIILTSVAGYESTHWAEDWTRDPRRALKAVRAALSAAGGGNAE